ncbi:tape measure domain-containing protein [Caulobacter sp. BE264]|uniref:tape measure protein n=1 Tax=Caulobacter sp. BE264 TaxID=2817724 RepID=UPI002856B816|nr:tape measure protein [Caulobacter sp. BE264]MDR7230636.1 tape measure domain-containing protein [Caulobacter sp. BE264]
MADIDVQRLLVRLEARIDKYEQALSKANAQTDRRARAIEARFDQSVRKLDDAGRKMGRVYDPLLAASKRMEGQLSASSGKIRGALLATAAPLGAGLVAGLSANKIKDYADGYTRYTNQLKVAGLEGQNLTTVQDRLYASAQKYGAPLEQLGTLYGRTASAQKELGASTEDLLRFTNGTAAALKVQGGSAEEARGALLQLTQGLGSTVFRAEEFNSVLEGARPIIQAVARGSDRWGGSIAKLRADIIAGSVSNKEFFQAGLVGFRETERVADKSVLTIAASFQILNNALGKYIGETDSSLSATARLSAGIQGVANNLELIVPALGVIGAAYGVRVAGGLIKANAAQIELALAVASGNAVMIDGARAAVLKSDAAVKANQAEIAAIQANIAALREEAAQYQANLALATEQRLAAKAAQAQAATNAAAGFGNIRVGAGALSAPVNAAAAATQFGEAGQNAIADRRRLAAVTKELEVAEAALTVASGRAAAAQAAHTAAVSAASIAARAGAVATQLFTGALTLIGGSVVGGAVVLALGAIVGAVILHNRHVKQAAEDQAKLRADSKALAEKLKETAAYGRAAAEGVKGLGSQAATATPKVTAFAGAVGQLADELFRAAEARKAEAIAALETQKSNAKVNLDKAIARQAEETRPVRNSALEEGGRGAAGAAASVGLNATAALANSNAAQEVARAAADFKAADAEIKRLRGLKPEAFVRPSDLTGKRDLPAELADLQTRLKIAQAAHNGAATRELQAQIYTLKKTSTYMKAGLKFDEAYALASKEAAEIKSAAEGYAAQQAGKKGARTALQEDRADLQHDRRYAADLARAQDDQLQAQADLTSSTQDRLKVELARIETARQARADELADQAKSAANPSGYSPAEIERLTKLANDTADKQKARAQAVADQEVADQAVALAENDLQNRTELLQAQQGLATTVAERRDLELKILDLQQQEERARTEAIIASKTATDAEKAIARQRLAALPAIEALQRKAVERANESQLASYRRSLIVPGTEQADQGVVEGLQTLRSSLVSAALESGNFASVLANVGRTIGEQIVGRLVDQLLIAPTAEAAEKALDALFGTASTAADAAGTTAASAKAAADGAAAVSAGALATAAASATAALLTLTAAATSSAGAEGAGFVAGFLGLRGGGAIPGYAGGGGLVRGPGGPRDDAILAQLASGRFLKLSDEEFVVNAQATREHRGLLEAINSGTLRGYAGGGSIATGGALSTVRKVNSLSFSSGLANGGRQSVFQFDLRGAILTEDLMHDINGKISAAESRAAIRGAQGGAAMAQAQIQKAAASRLGR